MISYHKYISLLNDIKEIFSTVTLLNYPVWINPFIVQTYSSYKHLGDVIIQKNKYIALFSITSSTPERNYTTTDK